MAIIKSVFLVVIFVTMIFNPQIVASSALFGINTWWNAVVPALLPFFIVSELLLNMGVMNCLSIWLEPIMRPVFKLPGAAALGIVMGFVSGSPTGANIAASLREQGLCTKNQGERLVAFTNNASPLYILVTVAIGILQSPQLGLLLFLSHYPLNLLFGICLRFFAKKSDDQPTALPYSPASHNNKNQLTTWQIIKKGLKAISSCPCPPIGRLLSICVKKSLINIGVVGGFIVVFSLLSAVLEQLGLIKVMATCLLPICQLFGIDPSLAQPMAAGFWEMTIGIAQMPDCGASLMSKTLAAAIILAWNGVSIQAQVAGMLHHTDIKLKYYLPLRIIHSFLAPLVLILAMPYVPTSAFTPVGGWIIGLSPIGLLGVAIIGLGGLSIAGLVLCKKYY